MDKFLGVIPEAVYAESNPVRQLAKRILNGCRDSFSPEEIGCIVDQRYFGFNPLVSLKESEENFLRNDMVKSFLFRFNKGRIREFLKSVCYQGTNCNGEVHVYPKKILPKDHGLSSIRIMTDEDKLLFLEDPENLHARWHEDRCETSFAQMGYRSFKEYSISRSQFTRMMRRLQSAKGRKELNVLDLGGGVGLALSNIKKGFPELVTYNATRDEEFCHYPADFHVIGFMERMPLVLQGTIDVIFSNMTTRYLAYTDLVIKSCVLMLAQGGIMDIFFSSERSDNPNEDDIKRRMKKAYDFLKNLELSKAVKLKIDHSFSSNVGGSFRSVKDSLYPAAHVFVKKL